jgi:hypothetical protein
MSELVIAHEPTFSDNEIRHHWIAEIAYHKAEKRGFEPGRELDDWLEAEAEAEAVWFESIE